MTERYMVPGKGMQLFREPESSASSLDSVIGNPYMVVDGVRLYRIGDLARALGRKPVTIRKWITQGYLPIEFWSLPNGAKGGRIRLYAYEELKAAREIANYNGLLSDLSKNVTKTDFVSQLDDAWEDLRLGWS
jgi:hypothetical protein